MLAVPASEIPEPETAWAAEFKWDGVRAVAYCPRDGCGWCHAATGI